MSASNIILQPSAAYIFSDAAAWSPDGTLARVQSKLHTFEKIRAAVVVRGMQPSHSVMAWALGAHTTLESLLRHLPKVKERVERWSRNDAYPDSVNEIEIAVVAWLSKEGRPAGWRLGEEGAASNEMVCSSILNFSPDIDSLDGFSKPLTCAEDVFALDAEQDGLALTELQRAKLRDPMRSGHAFSTVGGFCEVAVCSPAGVERKVLREWSDVIGEKIDPSPM